MANQRILVLLLMVGGAAGCHDDDPLANATNFRNALISRVCGLRVECGDLGQSEMESCLRRGRLPPANAGDLVTSGVLVFDASAAADCLVAYDHLSCADMPSLLNSDPPACHAALRGTAPYHAPCRVACAAGFYCDNPLSDCSGSCERFVADGALCVEKGQVCDFSRSYCSSGTSRCVGISREGNPCVSSGMLECAAGRTCLRTAGSGEGRCGAPRKLGEPCLPASTGSECDRDLMCDSRIHTCVPLLGAGQPCRDGLECAGGLACVGLDRRSISAFGICSPWLDFGDACKTPQRFATLYTVTGCPSSMPCSNDGHCGVLSGDGVRCNDFFDCQSRYCDPATGRCDDQAGFGDDCTPRTSASGEQCASGTCDPASRQCVEGCL